MITSVINLGARADAVCVYAMESSSKIDQQEIAPRNDVCRVTKPLTHSKKYKRERRREGV